MMPPSPPLLEAKHLVKHYPVSQSWLKPKAWAHALNGISLTLTPGKTLAIVGESGCGKSTLARQITMLEAPTGGELWIEGINPAQADRAARQRVRPLVQMVFQNPYASLNPRKKVSALLEEPLIINTSLNQAERNAQVEVMMAKVGLRAEHITRYPHMFSGGQRQRIAIARALMLNPKIIVADEPVSALDVSIQAQILNLLMDLQKHQGVAYLFISHNLSVVNHIADEVLVMYLGRMVEQGDKLQVLTHPRHPYTQALLASAPRLHAARWQPKQMVSGDPPSPLALPSGCAFHTRCPYAIARCRQEIPQPSALEGRWIACHRVKELG